SRAARSWSLLPKRGPGFVVVAELENLAADDLAGLVSLARDQQHVAALKSGNGGADRVATIADLTHVGRTPGTFDDAFADRGWILAARIVVGDDDAVGLLCRDRAHQRTLAFIAVATGAEHHDEMTLHVRPQRLDGLLQRIRLVRVVDKHRRAIPLANQIEPALGPLQRFERLEHWVGRAAGRNRKTGRHQRVLDLERTDQRQTKLVALACMFDSHGLGETVARGVD